MPTERLPMTRIKEILRLRWQQRRSVRETASGVGCSVGVVSKVVSRASLAGLTFEAVQDMGEETLEERLYGRPAAPSDDRPRPDPVYLHQD